MKGFIDEADVKPDRARLTAGTKTQEDGKLHFVPFDS